jgi:hypothetical protein
VGNVDDRDAALLIVDPIEDPICAASCTVAIIERRAQPFANPVRVIRSGANDELVCRERGSLR